MKFRLELTCISDEQEVIHPIALLERSSVALETLGLTLAEGKTILKTKERRSQPPSWNRRSTR